MRVVIRMPKREERKALAILLRHSPGTILPGGTYVLTPEAVGALREAGIHFTQLGSEADPPVSHGVPAGERI